MNPILTNLHTGIIRHSPPIPHSPPTNTSSTFPQPSISLVLRRNKLMSPSHKLVIPLPIASTRLLRFEKMESIKLLWGFEPGLQRWGLTVLPTMLPCTAVPRIPERTYWHQPNPGLALDKFLFPDTTTNNFLCLTTPQQ